MDSGRLPDEWDEAIRLFYLAYQDEWFANELWDVFYNSDGSVNERATRDWFHKPPETRSWDTMGRALECLSGYYEPSEETMFVRDIGFLYAGMPGRRQSTGRNPYWSVGGMSGNLDVFIQAGSIDPRYVNTTTKDQNDEDANVHHWAWAFNLGYNLPLPAAQSINLRHEWEQGSGPPWNRRMDVSDLEMGNRGAQMGNALAFRGAGYAQIPDLFERWLGVGGD